MESPRSDRPSRARGAPCCRASPRSPPRGPRSRGLRADARRSLRALSKTLTGIRVRRCRRRGAMLRAMTAAFGAQPLQKIASIASSTPPGELADALREAGLDAVAPRVVVALYSGVVDTPHGSRRVRVQRCARVAAVPWTKPNAVCGGPTDYWATAPVGEPSNARSPRMSSSSGPAWPARSPATRSRAAASRC